MAGDLSAYLAKGVFGRSKSGRTDLRFFYNEEKFPMDVGVWGRVYISFFDRLDGKARKIDILVDDCAIGERARDSLMWMDNYVEAGSVNEGEFRLKIGENDRKVVDYIRVIRGNKGFLEVLLKDDSDYKKVFDAVFKCAIAPLLMAIQAATREG